MEILHVCNRGVDKRTVFLDDSDKLRFIHDMFAFNDSDPTANYAQPGRHNEHSRDCLVSIHAYCLMPNHYHLLLSALVDDGVSLFMKKLNGGYSKYFNERYARTGALWQGRYRRTYVERDAHMLYIPYYIHLNPLDLTHPEWRTGSVRKADQALAALKAYRWSSHLDYSGIKNFPSLLDRSFLAHELGTPLRYERELRSIINSPTQAANSTIIELP